MALTYIPGKDAPLEQSIQNFKAKAQAIGLDLAESGWLNPLPNIYSVHLYCRNCPVIYSNGKGSSRLAALASAYGELFERLSTRMSFSEFYLGEDNAQSEYVRAKDEQWFAGKVEDEIPETLLNPQLREIYDPEAELKLGDLFDLQQSDKRQVCALPFTQVSTGQQVLIPQTILDTLYGSNGMSAGNTMDEAEVQALSEILERYVKRQIISKGLALPPIPPEVIAKYPKAEASIAALKGSGFKLICYDASLGGKYPVICSVIFNPKQGKCAASFGAHPLLGVALDRTLTELLQGRTLQQLELYPPEFDLDKTGDPVNLISQFIDSTGLLPLEMFKPHAQFEFCEWNGPADTKEQVKYLQDLILNAGYEIYIRKCTDLGINACRIIVPGMSEIYPADDLIYNNANAARPYLEACLKAPALSLAEKEALIASLEQSDIPDEEPIGTALGLLIDKDHPWSGMRWCEFKCLLCLSAGKEYFEDALAFAQIAQGFTQAGDEHKGLFYAALIQALQLTMAHADLKAWSAQLSLIYGSENCEAVIDHIEGRRSFLNIKPDDLHLKGFKAHQALIGIFNQLKQYGSASHA